MVGLLIKKIYLQFIVVFFSYNVGDLAHALEAANSLLEEWRVNKAPSNQNWGQRISNLNESWAGVRQSLFNSVLSTFGVHPERSICSKCLKNPAVIRCYECHMHIQLCFACDQSVHEVLPFHDRSALKSGFFKPIPPTVSVDQDGKWVSVGLCFLFIFYPFTYIDLKIDSISFQKYQKYYFVLL